MLQTRVDVLWLKRVIVRWKAGIKTVPTMHHLSLESTMVMIYVAGRESEDDFELDFSKGQSSCPSLPQEASNTPLKSHF